MTRRDSESAERCPLCGGARTPWGCRKVPLGDWCAVNGLREDVARLMPAPERNRPEDHDAGVRAAQKALETAQQQYDGATARWEAAALAGLQARSARYAAPMVSVGGALVDVSPAGATHADLRRLREAEEAAEHERRRAGDLVVRQRMALEAARAAARRPAR